MKRREFIALAGGEAGSFVEWVKRSEPTNFLASELWSWWHGAKRVFAHPTKLSWHRHCEEQSDEAIHLSFSGLLRCARNDVSYFA